MCGAYIDGFPRMQGGRLISSRCGGETTNGSGVTKHWHKISQWGGVKERAMTTRSHPLRHNRPVNDGLHPLVYKVLVGLALWFVLSVWILFNRGAYTGLNIAIVTLFFFIAVA